MMTIAQQKAWECLTSVEQKSLFLQVVQGKTSWEVGEILGISHYKYLELRERSHKFFKMMTNYYEKYTSLFNPLSNANDIFRDYIEASIEKRFSKTRSRSYTGDSSQLVPSISDKNILRNMGKLRNSKSQWDKDLYVLILEFDRWNTHRILPSQLQLESAYKRRVNKKFKIYLKWLMRTKAYIVKKLEEKFATRAKKKIYYVCLTSKEAYRSKGYKVIKIRSNDRISKKELTRLSIYVWSNPEDAQSFGIMASLFTPKTATIRTGLKFWPEYHALVKRAVNYHEVSHMGFTLQKLDSYYDSLGYDNPNPS